MFRFTLTVPQWAARTAYFYFYLEKNHENSQVIHFRKKMTEWKKRFTNQISEATLERQHHGYVRLARTSSPKN